MLFNIFNELKRIVYLAHQEKFSIYGSPDGLLFIGGQPFQRNILAGRIQRARMEAECVEMTAAVFFNGKATVKLAYIGVPLPDYDTFSKGKPSAVKLDGWETKTEGPDRCLVPVPVVQPPAKDAAA